MRLFNTEKLYDYKTLEKAKKHRDLMKSKGWEIVINDGYKYIDYGVFENNEDIYKYSVIYRKY